MAQKLIALTKGECAAESPDNPQFQEAAVSGHILLLIIRERLENTLSITRRKIEFEAKRKGENFLLSRFMLILEIKFENNFFNNFFLNYIVYKISCLLF